MEVTSDIVNSLMAFTFRIAAENKGQNFLELYQKWQQVVKDLREIGKLSVLDHKPMLAKVRQKFPSSATRAVNCHELTGSPEVFWP